MTIPSHQTDRKRTAAGHTEPLVGISERSTRRRIDVGDPVRVERDETRYPSRGTWPQFRGRSGTVVEVNRAGRGATEYGITFTKKPRTDAWFKRHELTHIGDAS